MYIKEVFMLKTLLEKIFCIICKKNTPHKHLHNTAHGISETHMAGSERYECQMCRHSIFKNNPEAKGLKFMLD